MRRDESRGDHASRPTRYACDREKRGLQWVWGRVGGFDLGSGFGLELDSGSGSVPGPGSGFGSGQIRVKGR